MKRKSRRKIREELSRSRALVKVGPSVYLASDVWIADLFGAPVSEAARLRDTLGIGAVTLNDGRAYTPIPALEYALVAHCLRIGVAVSPEKYVHGVKDPVHYDLTAGLLALGLYANLHQTRGQIESRISALVKQIHATPIDEERLEDAPFLAAVLTALHNRVQNKRIGAVHEGADSTKAEAKHSRR